MDSSLQRTIDRAWEARASLDPTRSPEVRDAVEAVITALDAGELRVAEKKSVGEWTVNQWVKKAVLRSFRLSENRFMQSGELAFYDKVEPKFSAASEEQLRASGVRVVLFLKPEAPREWRSLYKRAGKRDVRDVAEAICAQQRCRVVDERWALSGAQFTDSLAHYTAAANRQLARGLAPAVEQALERR